MSSYGKAHTDINPTGFILNPSDQYVFANVTAVFHCQYYSALETHFGWVVNGSAINRIPSDHPCNPTTSISVMNNSLTSTLRIIAVKECNGTEVYCVSVTYNGSRQVTENSFPAVLTVRGRELRHKVVNTVYV